jgi:hypothetical protein
MFTAMNRASGAYHAANLVFTPGSPAQKAASDWEHKQVHAEASLAEDLADATIAQAAAAAAANRALRAINHWLAAYAAQYRRAEHTAYRQLTKGAPLPHGLVAAVKVAAGDDTVPDASGELLATRSLIDLKSAVIQRLGAHSRVPHTAAPHLAVAPANAAAVAQSAAAQLQAFAKANAAW